MQKFLFTGLRILTGLVFVLSALVKLYPAEILEISIVETGLINWALAPFAARLLIALEFFLGLMLISGLYTRLFLRASLFTLIFFTIYLAILLLTTGNDGNCNCFGLLIPMTPLESIIKNVVLMLILFALIKRDRVIKWRFSLVWLIAAGVLSNVASFALAPIVISSYKPGSAELNYQMELELVYDDPEAEQPAVDLKNGKWILIFASSTCQQCHVAAYKFHVMKQNHPEFPFYIFINGDDEGVEEFFSQTRARDIPNSRIKAPTLLKLSGNRLPAIIWLNDGIIVNKSTLYGMDEHMIAEWLNNSNS